MSFLLIGDTPFALLLPPEEVGGAPGRCTGSSLVFKTSFS
jgi:hypothetical protein